MNINLREDTDELTQVLQGLHMNQIIGINDDRVDEDGPNDIDISRINGSARKGHRQTPYFTETR